jgi:CheY-like chemotaxis protein
LQQVFWNLLTNAIKFTPEGGRVDIHLERVAADLVVTVRDTGQGIDPAFLPHAFDRFRQADSSASPRQSGLGLGLTIVQQLVELHGGSARAESEGIGHGATFTVRLPAESDVGSAPASRAHDGSLSPSLRGVRVLLVDDDRDTRLLIARVLTDSHAIAEAASSVDEALARLSAFDPHVVISDIGMPGKDGYALIRAIRSSDRPARVPAIALTAFARSADRARSLAAGFDHHVVKPVDAHELRVTVAALLRERGGAQ